MKLKKYLAAAAVGAMIMSGVRAESAPVCQNLDFNFVLDFSGSENQQLNNQKEAFVEILNQFQLSEHGVKIAATLFSNYKTVIATLGDPFSSDNALLETAIEQAYNGGVGTLMNLGMEQVQLDIPNRRPGVTQVVAIVSDFVTQNIELVKQLADAIKSEGNVRFVCLVVQGTDTIEEEHWNLIRYVCDEQDIHIYPNHQALLDDAVEVSRQLCDEEVITASPTNGPTGVPTKGPTGVPTKVPTGVPTKVPTGVPTDVPTDVPTVQEISNSTVLVTPSNSPSKSPSVEPTVDYTAVVAGSLLGLLSLISLYPITRKRLKVRGNKPEGASEAYISPYVLHIDSNGKQSWVIEGLEPSTSSIYIPKYFRNGSTGSTMGIDVPISTNQNHTTVHTTSKTKSEPVDKNWKYRPAVQTTVADSASYMTKRPVRDYEFQYSPMIAVILLGLASAARWAINMASDSNYINKGKVFDKPNIIGKGYVKHETLMQPVHSAAEILSPCFTPVMERVRQIEMQCATNALESTRNTLSKATCNKNPVVDRGSQRSSITTLSSYSA